MTDKINVLDKGYVRLVDVMGSDTTVANAARVSYDKAVDTLGDKDKKLINFLASHGHSSPFRHAQLQFEIYAPLMTARQWWKYQVGSEHNTVTPWNESSRRYVTEEPTFYIPKRDEWRSTPTNKKQGSGEPVDSKLGNLYTNELNELVSLGEKLYNIAMKDGICAEQARLFLPAYGLYVRWYWTASLQSVAHFIKQRTDSHAQKEIQLYAHAVKELTKEKFPVSINALI